MNAIVNRPSVATTLHQPMKGKPTSLGMLLAMLSQRVSKKHMPSGSDHVTDRAVTYLATDHAWLEHPMFPALSTKHRTGLYAFHGDISHKTFFAHLLVGDFQILINLRTEDALVRFCGNADHPARQFARWPNGPGYALGLDTALLLNELTTHF